jgi:hypothetical protein
MARGILIGSGQGRWFKNHQRIVFLNLNQPFFMLRAIALALRARLREVRSLRDIS